VVPPLLALLPPLPLVPLEPKRKKRRKLWKNLRKSLKLLVLVECFKFYVVKLKGSVLLVYWIVVGIISGESHEILELVLCFC
jgi:hypothetical protein